MAIGTSVIRSSRFCAVTTTSSTLLSASVGGVSAACAAPVATRAENSSVLDMVRALGYLGRIFTRHDCSEILLQNFESENCEDEPMHAELDSKIGYESEKVRD